METVMLAIGLVIGCLWSHGWASCKWSENSYQSHRIKHQRRWYKVERFHTEHGEY